MLIFFFSSLIIFKEKGIIRNWVTFFVYDTTVIYYTLDKNLDKFAEELKVLKYHISNNKINSKKIYNYKNGIGDIKIKNDTLFFSLYDYLKDKKTKKIKKIFSYRRGKIKKVFEEKRKNYFFYKFDFYKDKEEKGILLDKRGKIILLSNDKEKEISTGIFPVFFKSHIFFLHGKEEGKVNSLFTIKKGKDKKIFFDRETVLEIDRESNFLFFLTDSDNDLLPEKIYIIDSLLNLHLLFESENHIIIKPSFFLKQDTLLTLLSLSEEFIPEKILLLRIHNNKIIFQKEIIKRKGIECKWLNYPYIVLLQKKEDYSLFELISIK